eukprot:scaffold5698_cov47-Attheya_sp.AAC.1
MVEEANCDHSKLCPQLCTEQKKIHPKVPFETSQVRSGDCEVSGARDTQRVRSRLSKQFKIPCMDGALRSYVPSLNEIKSVFEDYHPGTIVVLGPPPRPVLHSNRRDGVCSPVVWLWYTLYHQ